MIGLKLFVCVVLLASLSACPRRLVRSPRRPARRQDAVEVSTRPPDPVTEPTRCVSDLPASVCAAWGPVADALRSDEGRIYNPAF